MQASEYRREFLGLRRWIEHSERQPRAIKRNGERKTAAWAKAQGLVRTLDDHGGQCARRQIQARAAIEVDITFGTVGALQAKLAAGETADVLILGAPRHRRMEQTGAVVAGQPQGHRAHLDRRRGARGCAGARHLDAGAFKQALIGARAVAFSDPRSADRRACISPRCGIASGLPDEIARKAMPQKSGGEVAARVARRQGRSRAHPDRRDRAGRGRARDRENPRAARQRHHLCRGHSVVLRRPGGRLRLHRRARANRPSTTFGPRPASSG